MEDDVQQNNKGRGTDLYWDSPTSQTLAKVASQANVFLSLYQVSKHNYYTVLKSQEFEEEKHPGKSWR